MKKLIYLTLPVLLTACGGGGGDSAEAKAEQPQAINAGLWKGQINSQSGDIYQAGALLDKTGRLFVIDENGVVDVAKISSGDFSTTLKEYYPLDEAVVTATFKGKLTTNSLTATASANGKSGSVSLTPNPSTLESINGNYSDLENSVAIDADGILTGSNTMGCIFTGQLTAETNSGNLYSVTMTVTNCDDANGAYSGLATYEKLYDEDTTKKLILAAQNTTNEEWVIAFGLE